MGITHTYLGLSGHSDRLCFIGFAASQRYFHLIYGIAAGLRPLRSFAPQVIVLSPVQIALAI